MVIDYISCVPGGTLSILYIFSLLPRLFILQRKFFNLYLMLAIDANIADSYLHMFLFFYSPRNSVLIILVNFPTVCNGFYLMRHDIVFIGFKLKTSISVFPTNLQRAFVHLARIREIFFPCIFLTNPPSLNANRRVISFITIQTFSETKFAQLGS